MVPGLDTVIPLETTAAYDILDVILGVGTSFCWISLLSIISRTSSK